MSKYVNDGRWRAGLTVAALLMLFAVAELYALNFELFSAIIRDALSGHLSPARVFAAPFDVSNIWFAVLIGGASITTLVSSSRARLRMRQRLFAIAGNADAIPLARANATDSAFKRPDETPPPDWTSTPDTLRLGWREQQYTRQRWAPVVGCLGLLGALAAGIVSLVGALLLIRAIPITGSWFAPLVVLGVSLAACLAVGIPMWRATMRLAEAGPVPAHDENALIADDAGLTWLRPGQLAVHMHWTDVRLLEVALTFSGKDTTAWRVYTLWDAEGRSISWPVYNVGVATTQRVPDEPARVALARAADALLALIHERTGLTARTFDAALLADARQAQPWFGTVILEPTTVTPATSPLLFLLTGILLCCALALPLLPLTSELWVNIYAALSLLIVGLLSLRTIRRWRRSERRSPNPTHLNRITLPAASPAPDTDALFTLAQRPTLTTTLAVWLLAPSCILDGVVALVAILTPGSHYGGSTLGSTLAFTTNAVLAVIALGGVVGLLIGIANGGPRRIVAGPERLSMGPEGAANPRVSILWPKVTAIIAIVRRDGRVVGYRVEGANPIGSDTINWRHDPRSIITAPSPRPLLQRAQPITPDELAALVVARTGLPLEAREA